MCDRLSRFFLKVFVVAAMLGSNAHAEDEISPASLPAGSILSESSRDLGNGYLEVSRSVVNPPSHWEGIGHFDFVYFKDEKLCQCNPRTVAISPRGEFAIYVAQDGRLMLFRAAKRSRTALTRQFEGYPIDSDWQLSRRRVSLTLEKYVDGRGTKSKHEFRL